MSESIGYIFDLSESDYDRALGEWLVSVPPDLGIQIRDITKLRYIGLRTRGARAVASVAEWRVNIANENALIAVFSTVVEGPSDASEYYLHDPQIKEWNLSQREALLASFQSNSVRVRPDDELPCLTLNEAASSVARRFGIDPDQVEILIRSKYKNPDFLE